MISRLNHKIVLLDKKSAASADEIALLRNRFPDIPSDYVNLIGESTEIELRLLVDPKKYVRIWGPNGCLELVDAYQISECLPESIPVGDDGSASCLMYMIGNSGWGLYLCDFSVLDRTYAKWLASSISQFLIDGIGIDVF